METAPRRWWRGELSSTRGHRNRFHGHDHSAFYTGTFVSVLRRVYTVTLLQPLRAVYTTRRAPYTRDGVVIYMCMYMTYFSALARISQKRHDDNGPRQPTRPRLAAHARALNTMCTRNTAILSARKKTDCCRLLLSVLLLSFCHYIGVSSVVPGFQVKFAESLCAGRYVGPSPPCRRPYDSSPCSCIIPVRDHDPDRVSK